MERDIENMIMITIKTRHWRDGLSVHQWSSHTKDSKNGT